MGSVVKDVFGGKDDSAQDLQTQQNQIARDFIKSQGTQARQDILDLFPAADQNRNLGNQAALDVLAQSAPQSIEAFQSGNLGAQAAILGGTPMLSLIGRNGGRMTLNDFNNRSATGSMPLSGIDPSFLSQQLPEFVTTDTIAQSPDAKAGSLISNMRTDADLISAAATGQIPGISGPDQRWFSTFLSGNPQLGRDNSFLRDPQLVIDQTVGKRGGLNAKNEQRLANLLRKVKEVS